MSETKNGLREMEKIPVVISFPRLFSLRPKRSEVSKWTNVIIKKIKETIMNTAPAIFKKILSKSHFVSTSGRTKNENLNAGFTISNSQSKKNRPKTGKRNIVALFFFPLFEPTLIPFFFRIWTRQIKMPTRTKKLQNGKLSRKFI